MHRPDPKGFLYGGLIAVIGLQGCSDVSSFVRHRDPLTPEEHIVLGSTYAEQGLPNQAEKQYQAALILDKHNILALLTLGNAAFEAHRWKQAEIYFRHVLKKAP